MNNEEINLPTWDEIFSVANYREPYEPALEMMQRIENAGHGSSIERELLNLVINYNRSRAEIKERLFDMQRGIYYKMYSYQGWDTLFRGEEE